MDDFLPIMLFNVDNFVLALDLGMPQVSLYFTNDINVICGHEFGIDARTKA